ncbi:MAG TPA: PAS domain-containing sensor histidine kinase, partial [Casimicrobiaceae bacterium]|nr:PAS domain-containing sensor histidine kinase [Casimicrobiaceae bacterium]
VRIAKSAAWLVGLCVVLAAVAWSLGWYRSTEALLALLLMIGFVTAAVFLLQGQALQKRAAITALHNAEARVGRIVEAAMDPIISCDSEQRIVLFNAAAEKVFQWPRNAVLGQPLEMLIPERFRGVHREDVERFGNTGETTRRMGGPKVVLMALRANGQEFPIDASISHHHENGASFYTVILRDVTERVQAESMLERSEARLRGILDSAMDAIITVDERQHIVLFNHAAEKMFKCPQAEAIGAPLAWFIPERFRGTHGDHIKRFGDTGVSSRRMGGLRVVTGLARDGREFPIDASISQLNDSGGKFYTVILRDITERVKAEEALRASKQELQELATAANAAREQEQSRIARELHDELGQALTALKMMTAWIAQRTPPENLEMTAKTERMSSVIDNTLKAASRISAQLRPLILDDLGLVPALEWLIEGFVDRTGIECDFATEGDLELDDARKSAVFRVVQESLTNVTRHAKATHVRVRVARSEDAIAIHVRDNGVGFDMPAERSRTSRGLLGMRERAYLLGGEFAIRSAPGEGTAVDVRIPLTAAIQS